MIRIHTIVVTHTVAVELDHGSFTQPFMSGFRYAFDTVERHAAFLGYLYACGVIIGERPVQIEGYGPEHGIRVTTINTSVEHKTAV